MFPRNSREGSIREESEGDDSIVIYKWLHTAHKSLAPLKSVPKYTTTAGRRESR